MKDTTKLEKKQLGKIHPFIAEFLLEKQTFDKKYSIPQFAKQLGFTRSAISHRRKVEAQHD